MKLSLVYFFWYKVSCLIVGTVSIWLGYLCFANNYIQKSGDLAIKYKVDSEMTLSQAAPGTFFSVLGSFIIIFTIIKGFKIEGVNQKENNDFDISGMVGRIVGSPPPR